MATITAELTVSSDITTDLSINKSMTMTKADSDVGLERTSSLNRVYLEDATQVELLSGALAGSPVADMTLAKAAKVYIKYISTDKSRYITVGFGTASGTPTPTPNKELLAPGQNAIVRSISLTNVNFGGSTLVDIYIEKKLTGKFYSLKKVELPVGVTLSHDISFSNITREFGLYIKLTKADSFTITGSINPDGSNPADGTSTLFLSELGVGDALTVNTETKIITALLSNVNATMDGAFSAGSADTTVECNPKSRVDVILS